MIRQPALRTPFANTVVRVAMFVAGAALLAGCASIPQRAWHNGDALSRSSAYQRVMNGDMSFSSHRQLQQVINFGGAGYYKEAPMYSPFPKRGSWY